MLHDPRRGNPILRTLLDAREKVSDRKHWACNWDELNRDRHCLTTAFGCDFPAHTAFLRANELDEAGVISNVIHFNDTHTHAEVLAALERAIVRVTQDDGGSDG